MNAKPNPNQVKSIVKYYIPIGVLGKFLRAKSLQDGAEAGTHRRTRGLDFFFKKRPKCENRGVRILLWR